MVWWRYEIIYFSSIFILFISTSQLAARSPKLLRWCCTSTYVGTPLLILRIIFIFYLLSMGPLWGNSSVARVSGSYWDFRVVVPSCECWEIGGIGTVWHGFVPAGSACTVPYVGRSFGYAWDYHLIKGTRVFMLLKSLRRENPDIHFIQSFGGLKEWKQQH